MNSDRRTEPAEAYCFSSFSDSKFSKYIWMDSRLKGLSIESKKTQNRTRTRKLWSSEVGDLAQIVQQGSCVKPTKLHSRGFFKALIHAIFPT